MLTISTEEGEAGPRPVKTVPGHYTPASFASDDEFALVFGEESEERFFIGNPLDMETRLCLNLPELVKRSNGVFGKSGTGKTFLTRLLLVGMLQKSAAVNLIFDMHSEYGWAGTREGAAPVKALKQLFPEKVAVFAIDEENARRRKVNTDFIVKIGYEEIEAEDISLLRQPLNLTDIAVEAVYQLRRRFGKKWLQRSIELGDAEDVSDQLKTLNIPESTFQNLLRGLSTITRLPFVVEKAPQNAVETALAYLDNGKNVVLEFGRYTDVTAYILVANLLTRRIHALYRERTELAMGEEGPKPTPLVITIEEAHRFLNPAVASYTIFGTIAREMRKYNVSLLVIDQRPSGIDPEVMSQMGTKITCLLDNEHDIDSVLSGVSGKSALKAVLARLQSKQEALIFGHAVPMPVAFHVRDFGTAQSYRELGAVDKETRQKKAADDIEKLWG